jgi:hypothetical protein
LRDVENKNAANSARAASRVEFSGVAVSDPDGRVPSSSAARFLLWLIQAPCQQWLQGDMSGKIRGLMPRNAPLKMARFHAFHASIRVMCAIIVQCTSGRGLPIL